MDFTRTPLVNLFVNLIIVFSVNYAGAIELRGNVTAEARHFYKSPVRSDQEENNLSLSAEPEFYHSFPDSRDSLNFIPFFRIDQNDSERSHADIRELKWHKVAPNWELRVGVDRVFWGVTETVHLVNIINQIDLVENPDEEDMLGQPMINLTLVQNWGSLDFFLLPYFRERPFPGREGRPGSIVSVSNDKAIYESGAEEWHTDFAIRWSHTSGPWDMGLAHFYGTSREPELDPSAFTINSHGEVELIPIYDIIHQTGVDIQGTFEAWLLKLEAIHRSGHGDRFFAAATGFEYTFFDIAESGKDIGVICEYIYDERDTSAMDNDLAMGVRLSFNDIQSTEILAVAALDVDNSSSYFYLEASRRIGDAFKLSIEIRGVSNVDDQDPLSEFEADSYMQLEFGFFF